MSTGPLGDPRAQRRMRDEEKQRTQIAAADLETVMRTEAGRRFIHRVVFDVCRLMDIGFNPSIKDGLAERFHSAHLDGGRLVGRLIADEANEHVPELWNLMIQEETNRANDLLARRRQANNSTGEKHDD